MEKNIKLILLECLNQNIRLEEMVYNSKLFEATVGSTGSTGSTPPPAGSTGGAGSGFGAGGTVGKGPVGGNLAALPGATADVLKMLGLAGGLGLAGFASKYLGNIPLPVYGYGVNSVTRNIENILPKQEALRKEGLGYTKGWAALADTK